MDVGLVGALLSAIVFLLVGCSPSNEAPTCDLEKESCTYCLEGRAIVTIHPDGSFIGKDCECVEPFEGFGECVK